MLLPQKCTKHAIYVVIEITSHNNIYFDSRKRSYNSYVAYRSFTALAFYPIKGEKKERKKRKKRKKKTKQRKNSNRRLEETKILDLSLGSRSKVARWRTHLLASCRCSVSSFCHRKAVRHRQFLIVSVIFHKTSRKRADVRRPFSPLLPASVGNRIARFSLRLLSLSLSLSLYLSRWFSRFVKNDRDTRQIRARALDENFSRHPPDLGLVFSPLCQLFRSKCR